MVTRRLRGQSIFQNVNAKTLHLPQPTSIAISSSSAAHTVTAQFNAAGQTDSGGNRVTSAYPWFLSGAADGLTLPAAEVTGASAGASGRVYPTSTSNFVHGIAITNSTGAVVVVLTDTGTSTHYIGFVLPNGRLAMSTAFTRGT